MAFKTPEQIAADKAAQLARAIPQAQQDHARRVEGARKRVTGVLAQAPDERFSGQNKILGLRVTELGRDRPMAAVHYLADHEQREGFDRDGFDARVGDLRVGDQVSLAGSWAKRQWKDAAGATKESWEFKTQFFAKGDVSLADMELEARARIGDAVLTTLPMGEALSVEGAANTGRPAASPSVTYASGNIIDDRAQVLVNTVNSQLSERGNGVMGKGVALAFKETFPAIMPDYENAIRSGALKPGRALLFDLPDGRVWAALATKDHFRDGSQEAWVDSGLRELGEKMREAGLTSVAITPPGCGNGGLDWKAIEPLVHKHLGDLDVSLYAKPSGAMEPAAARATEDRTRDVDAVKARQLAAMGGSAADRDAGASAIWTKDRLLAAIPELLSGNGAYKAYAGIGSRETPQDVADEMTAAARAFEARGLTLRSGGADKSKGVQPPGTKSADLAFEEGVSNPRMKEIFIPWKGFGTTTDGILLDRGSEESAERIAAAAHPGWDHCSQGAKRLHTRNVAQIMGPSLDSPSAFALCWTKNGAFAHEGPNGTNRDDGGTGQAIRIASQAASPIPVLNMRDPDIRAAVVRELGIGAGKEQQMEHAPVKQAERVSTGNEFDLVPPATRSRPKKDVEYFCKVSEEHGIQSNMATTPLKVGSLTYRGSENLYQALRFPEHPELQARIAAETPYNCKTLARDNEHLTRPDWKTGGVNIAAMAYAITVKHDQVKAFRDDLASTEGRDMVELSTRDPFWGAQARGDQLVGQDVLGSLLTQLRGGARMEEPPAGSRLPGLGEDRGVSATQDLPDPSIRASMYFAYGAARRPGFTADTTFDAILKGERTSTTRYPEWGPLARYDALKPGDVARFYEDKEMKGRHVDVVVTGVNRIDLRSASPGRLEEWSRAEGWSVQHARDSGRKHAEGTQIRYALPGTPDANAALAERGRGSSGREMPSQERAPVRNERSGPTLAQRAALSAKDKALSLF